MRDFSMKNMKHVDEDVWLTALVPKEIFNALLDYGKKHRLNSMSVVARQAFAFFLEHRTSKNNSEEPPFKEKILPGISDSSTDL